MHWVISQRGYFTFISKSDGIAIARAFATSDNVRMQLSTFTLWSTDIETKWHWETLNAALSS